MLNADGSVRGYAFRRVKPDNTATSPLPKSKNASKNPIPVPKVSGLTIYSKIPLDDGQKKGKMGDSEGPLIFAGSRKQRLFSTDTVLPKEEGRNTRSGVLASRKQSEMGLEYHTNSVPLNLDFSCHGFLQDYPEQREIPRIVRGSSLHQKLHAGRVSKFSPASRPVSLPLPSLQGLHTPRADQNIANRLSARVVVPPSENVSSGNNIDRSV